MDRLEQLKYLAFFPVSKSIDPETGKYMVAKNTGEKIAEVSEDYELVRNEEVVMPFINHFGIDRLVKVDVSNARRSYAFEFKSGRVFDFDGDQIEERLIIRNSYDKTKAFSFMFGAFRFVCSNGLYYAVNSALVYRKIHLGNIPVQDIVYNALNTYEQNDFSFFKKMLEIPLSKESELEMAKQWVPFEVDPEAPKWRGNALLNRDIQWRVSNRIIGEETKDNQRNAWGLYNQMNQAVRRSLPTSAMNKRILGDQRALEFIGETLAIK